MLDSFPQEHSGISFNDLCAYTYLYNCINELVRIGSPIPITVRQAAQDTTLPTRGGPSGKSPTFIPKDTRAILDLFQLQYRKDIWGSDTKDCRAERWDYAGSSLDFRPFGGESRASIERKCHSFAKASKGYRRTDSIHAEKFAIPEVSYATMRLPELCDKIEIPQIPEEILSDAAGCQQASQREPQTTSSRYLLGLRLISGHDEFHPTLSVSNDWSPKQHETRGPDYHSIRWSRSLRPLHS